MINLYEYDEKINKIIQKDRVEWKKRFGNRKYDPEYLKKNGFFVNNKEPKWNFTR